jgi:segregation and condensation protein B
MVGEMMGGTVGDMVDDAVVDVAGEGDRDGSSLVEREIDLDNPDCPDIDNTGISVTGTDDPQLVEAHLEGAYVGTEDALADYSRADDTRAYLEQRRAIEAVLMVAESPVEPTMLAQLLELPPATVDQICDELARSYRNDQRGFELARVAGGYRFQSHPDMAPYIERFVLEGQSARLSAAALESLAIVAYKQPISRAQVASIRGVNSDGVLRTLCIRGYVTEVARDPGPGQALLYGTTTLLLERLGLDKIEDLPPLGDFVPGPEVMDALEQGLRSG